MSGWIFDEYIAHTSRSANMTSSASWPLDCLTNVPTTVISSLSSALRAHDISPSPTATPLGCSFDDGGLLADTSGPALGMLTGAGADFDSRGSRT